MSLVAKNQSSPNHTDTRADSITANNVEVAPATIDKPSEEELPRLMRLPTELRLDILERVIHSTFEAEPYGLTPPPMLPVTIYTSVTRLPAVLHVNQIMRNESVALYLDLARRKITQLENENKKIYLEFAALKKDLGDSGRLYTSDWTVDSQLQGLNDDIVGNFRAMREVSSSLKALQGTYERKQALPKRWQERHGW